MLLEHERGEGGNSEENSENDGGDEKELLEASSGVEYRAHIVRTAQGPSVCCARLLEQDGDDEERRNGDLYVWEYARNRTHAGNSITDGMRLQIFCGTVNIYGPDPSGLPMDKPQNPLVTFLDRFLDVPETKVTYLTKVTWIDRVLARVFLPLLSDGVTPNQITKFRLVSVPFVALLLALDLYLFGTILFLFAAFSDALDGALARTKKKVTTWGTLYDPIADKLLVGTVATIVISKHVSLYLALAIIVIEILLVSFSYYRYKGRIVPAKTMGKTKMVLQCLGIIALLFYILFGVPVLLTVATYLLYAAVAFALLSLFVFRSI